MDCWMQHRLLRRNALEMFVLFYRIVRYGIVCNRKKCFCRISTAETVMTSRWRHAATADVREICLIYSVWRGGTARCGRRRRLLGLPACDEQGRAGQGRTGLRPGPAPSSSSSWSGPSLAVTGLSNTSPGRRRSPSDPMTRLKHAPDRRTTRAHYFVLTCSLLSK